MDRSIRLVAVPLQNLGIVARQNKHYARALELLWRAEAIKEKSLGAGHPQTATLLINLGNLYHGLGDYQKELELHQRALHILETAAGPYHNLTLLATVGRRRPTLPWATRLTPSNTRRDTRTGWRRILS